MLNSRWIRPACRKPPVTIRKTSLPSERTPVVPIPHTPPLSAIALAQMPPSTSSLSPPAPLSISARKASTLMASSA